MEIIKPILESIGRWVYSYRQRKNWKTISSATTSNKRLLDFLKDHDYGIKSNTSANKILSKIPDDLKHYFFRGLIDGDGCIYVNEELNNKKLIISSSVNQDWWYVENVCDKIGVKYNIYRKVAKNSSSIIEMNGINAKLFCDYIYQDKQFGLDRKYKKYMILTELFDNSKRTLDNIKKIEAFKLHNSGIPITKIIKATGIPSTTLRRFLTTII